MELVSEKQGNTVVVKVKGRMDSLTATDFEKRCFTWIERGETSFAIDFGELEYISSSGIKSILVVANKLRLCNGRICLCCLSGMVKKVISLTGYSSIIPIYDSLGQAFNQQ